MSYINTFVATLDDVSDQINNCSGEFFNDDVRFNFLEKCARIKDNLEDIANEERLLRVGILGTVKSGKSTFLNSLLFDGRNILPTDPTPATATLTFLRHTDANPSATLYFYSKEDWGTRISKVAQQGLEALDQECMKEYQNAIQQKSKEFGAQHDLTKKEKDQIRKSLYINLKENTRACIELVEKCNENKIHVSEYLGTQKTINFESVDEISNQLKKYIGSSGELTPIVRSVELSINHKMLTDIEIIDTPGLNDPVVSRSLETKKHLGKCDVVFFLSHTSHFFGAEDQEFIQKALPKEGIKHLVIIASQTDNAALDIKGGTFQNACGKSVSSALQAFNKHKHNFSGETQFQFVSALLASCAYKNTYNIPLSNEESSTIQKLSQRFTDFEDTPESLNAYSNLSVFKYQILPETKKRKESIKEARQSELLQAKQSDVEITLTKLAKSAQSFLYDLKNQDIHVLEKQAEDIHEALRSVRIEVAGLFSSAATRLNQNIMILENAVIGLIDHYIDLDVQVVNHKRVEHWETGMLFWKNRGYDTIIEDVDTVSVSNVLEQMRKYSTDVDKKIKEFYSTIVNITSLKHNIKKILINLFKNREGFNEDRILTPLEARLGHISISPFIFNNDEYNEKIEHLYGDGKVVGESIYELKTLFEKVMQDMAKNINKSLRYEGIKIEQELNLLAENFLHDIETSVRNDIEKIIRLKKDKEKGIYQIEKTITVLQDCVQKVQKLRA